MNFKGALVLAVLFVHSAFGASTPPLVQHNVMHGVTLSSCRETVCTRLVTDEVSRSSLSPGLMAFGRAHIQILSQDGKTLIKSYEASNGYYDLDGQVIVLRGLIHSKHSEMILNLELGREVSF